MTWDRAKQGQKCGLCGLIFHGGEPVALMTDAKKLRCAACSGLQPPADLEAYEPPIQRVHEPLPFGRFDAKNLPIDFKQKAVGE